LKNLLNYSSEVLMALFQKNIMKKNSGESHTFSRLESQSRSCVEVSVSVNSVSITYLSANFPSALFHVKVQ